MFSIYESIIAAWRECYERLLLLLVILIKTETCIVLRSVDDLRIVSLLPKQVSRREIDEVERRRKLIQFIEIEQD